MKYLKTYEDKKKKFKIYLVIYNYDFQKDYVEIVRNFGYDYYSNSLEVETLNTFSLTNTDYSYLIGQYSTLEFDEDFSYDFIIYTSDDLGECLKYAKIYLDKLKYNL